jgi:hypothetical protein
LRFFFTSRLKYHIETQFNEPTTNQITTHLALEDWDARTDIRLFLQYHLQRIHESKHRYIEPLPEGWPSSIDLDQLVRNSEGSFIWASTIVKFVDDGLPHEKLRSALNAHAGLDPLYHKCLGYVSDTLYRNWLSSSSGNDNCRRIIGYILLVRTPLSIEDLGCLTNFQSEEILQLVQGHRSFFAIPEQNNQAIRPFHSSLHDFLTNSERSKDLFINPAEIHFDLLLRCLTIIPSCAEQASRITLYACKSWCYHLNLTLLHETNFIQEPEKCHLLANELRWVHQFFENWIVYVYGPDRLQMLSELNSALSKLKVRLLFLTCLIHQLITRLSLFRMASFSKVIVT